MEQLQNHSQVMKIKEGQSNIFHIDTKDRFNSQAKPKKSVQDKIEIGAYNINWWNTNQYRDVPPQPVQHPSPYQMIQHHTRELENIYNQEPQHYEQPREKKHPLQDNVNESFKRKNHNFSDILESGLQKYYYENAEGKRDNRQIPNNLQWNQFDSRLHSKDYMEQKKQEKMSDLVQEMESNVRPGNQYAQRQMLKEMKSVFDTHNYYDQVLNPPPPPPPQPIVETIIAPEPPIEEQLRIQFVLANWIIRGVSSKFNWMRFREESEKLDVAIAAVVENIEKFSKQKVYSVTIKALQQKQLNEVEKKLLTQGGRVVKKTLISEEEFQQQVESQSEKPKPPPTPLSKVRAQSARVGKIRNPQKIKN